MKKQPKTTTVANTAPAAHAGPSVEEAIRALNLDVTSIRGLSSHDDEDECRLDAYERLEAIADLSHRIYLALDQIKASIPVSVLNSGLAD